MGKKTGALLATLALLSVMALASAPPGRPQEDQTAPLDEGLRAAMACSVSITAGDSAGSGVVFANGAHRYVWTVAHTLTELRGADGNWGVPTVMQGVEREDGIYRGLTVRQCSVIRYGVKSDIALLKTCVGGWPVKSVKFSAKRHPVRLGSSLWHVGCPAGEYGAFSVFKHYLAGTGREKNGHYYDQTGGPFYPGCSGGGLFSPDGDCVGLIARYFWKGAHGISLYVPTRELREFARKNDCEWAVDASLKVPTDTGEVVCEGLPVVAPPVLTPKEDKK